MTRGPGSRGFAGDLLVGDFSVPIENRRQAVEVMINFARRAGWPDEQIEEIAEALGLLDVYAELINEK